MSQPDNTLRETLRQHFKEFQETQEGNDVLRNLVEWILQELFELEFNEQTGAERCEKREERQGYRNGFRKRDLFTRVGSIALRVPRDRAAMSLPGR